MKNLIIIFIIAVIPNIAIAHENHETVKYRYVQETKISQSTDSSKSYYYISVLDTNTGKVKICVATASSKGEIRPKENKNKCTRFQ